MYASAAIIQGKTHCTQWAYANGATSKDCCLSETDNVTETTTEYCTECPTSEKYCNPAQSDVSAVTQLNTIPSSGVRGIGSNVTSADGDISHDGGKVAGRP